jgi:hypothetical protein
MIYPSPGDKEMDLEILTSANNPLPSNRGKKAEVTVANWNFFPSLLLR